MIRSEVFNRDCLEAMKEFPDGFIKPLIWDDETKIKHVYKCVSATYVNLPVQGDLKSHIAICDEDNYGFNATLWMMNGGYSICSHCKNIEEAKLESEKWWVNFVSGFLNLI
jgi:hypothetical protein